MGTSLVYQSAAIYELVMLGLYGRHYPARYRALAEMIPANASVLDVCCGPGILFERHLRRKGVDYLGLDINPRFVERVRRRGGGAMLWDLHRDEPLPTADYVTMQASLYQFLPDAAPIVERMCHAARECLIIAEPIRNLADSAWPWLATMAQRSTDPGLGSRPRRFTEATLDDLFRSLRMPLSRSFLIPGGREKVYVLDKAECLPLASGD
jgi:SAM-dependent methyltransferase